MDSADDIADGMETLDLSECESRLRAGGVGILALVGKGAPLLRPVNFVVQEGRIVIRTGEGRIFEAAHDAEPASFVISEIDRFEHTGWSVVVTGRLEACESLEEWADLPLRPWARATKDRFVALSIEDVSGRRIAENGNANGNGNGMGA